MTEAPPFRRVVGDSVLYGLSAAVAKALALVTVPYLTRALSPAGYGVSDLATSTAALLTLIVLFSGDIPAARAYAMAHEESARLRALSSYLRAVAMVSVAVFLILLPTAPLIAGTVWGAEELTPLAFLTLVLVPVSGVQAALAQVQRIQSRPRSFAVLSIVDLLAQLVLAVALVAAGWGPAGVVAGFVAGSTIGMVLAAVAARGPMTSPSDWSLALHMIGRGLQFLPYAVMFVLADWVLRSIVANTIGPAGVADLGVAIRIASVLSLLGAAFAMAWGPVGLARINDLATARLFGRVFRVYGYASGAAAFALAAVGPEIVRLVAGTGYDGARLILPGLAFGFAIAGTEYILVIAAGITDRAPRVALAATAGAALQIALSILLVPEFGIEVLGLVILSGRIASFALLLASVRPLVLVSTPSLVVMLLAAAIGFAMLRALVGEDDCLVLLRWGAAVAVVSLTAVFWMRYRRRLDAGT